MGYIELEIRVALAKLSSTSLEINAWKYGNLESWVQKLIIFFM